MAHPGGAPSKLTPEEKLEVYEAFQKYIDENENPMMVDFCIKDEIARKYKINKDNLNDWYQFTELRKRAIEKQELYLDIGASSNRINSTFAIFKLKQPAFGWTDKQQVQHSNDPDNPMPALIDKSAVDMFISNLKHDTNSTSASAQTGSD